MTSALTIPPVNVQVGFASTPLQTPQTWTDITTLLRSINIRRGRQHVLQNFEPGRLTMVFWGTDRSLDPFNTSGPYAPNVDVNKQVQVYATWNVLTLAQAGSNSVAPSGGWTGTNASVTYPGGSSVRMTSVASGTMSMTTPTGASADQHAVAGVTYTGIGSVQAGSTGRSCSLTITFFDVSGTNLGSTTGSTVTDNSGGTTAASVTAVAPANTVGLSLKPTVTATGGASEVHTWSQLAVLPFGAAAWTPGGPVNLFTGFLDADDPQWLDNIETLERLTATDSLRLLQSDTVNSSYLSLITTDGASDVWPFSDPATQGTQQAADVVGSVPGTYWGAYQLGAQGPSYSDPATAVAIQALGGEVRIGSLIPSQIVAPWSLECWVQVPQAPAANRTVWRVYNPAMPVSVYGPAVWIQSSGAIFLADSNNTQQITSTKNIADGAWHHIVVTSSSPSGLTSTARLYLDGSLVGTSTGSFYLGGGSTGVAFGSFTFGPLQTTYAYGAWYAATSLSAATVLNHYQAVIWPPEIAGTRIQRVINALPSALQPPFNASGGISLIAPPTGSLVTTTVLAYLQQVTKAENGFLYADASGELQFLNRYASLTSPRNVSLTTFGDIVPTEVPYLPKPDVGLDVLDLHNRSVVTRQGGVPQSAQNTTSQTKYGMNSTLTETGLLITQDAEALARAQWNVNLGAFPLPRVRSLTVDAATDPANRFPAVLFRELLDRVTVKRRPLSISGASAGFGNPAFIQDQYIEHVEHDISWEDPVRWNTTYVMWPALTATYWILGDPVLGVLDSTTKLAY